MSDIDLTEAIQAAMEGFCGDLDLAVAVADLSGIQQYVIREQALSYVTHAAPLIEAAVREQIARDIDLEAQSAAEDGELEAEWGLRAAARIARGVS